MKYRFRSFEFWDGAVFGAAACLVFAFLLGAFLEIVPAAGHIYLSSVAAVFAATLGVAGLFFVTKKQMSITREQDLAAARALLPLVLSTVSRATRVGRSIFSDLDHFNAQEARDALGKAVLDQNSLKVLTDVLKVSDPVSREWLAVLIVEYQICISQAEALIAELDEKQRRWGELVSSEDDSKMWTLERWNTVSNGIRWVFLDIIAANLFDFSRGLMPQAAKTIKRDNLKHFFFDLIFARGFADKKLDELIDARLARIPDSGLTAKMRLDELKQPPTA